MSVGELHKVPAISQWKIIRTGTGADDEMDLLHREEKQQMDFFEIIICYKGCFSFFIERSSFLASSCRGFT